MKTRTFLVISALYGLTGVIFGAFGAHALHPKLEAFGTVEAWRTAVFYQITHAIALFSLVLGSSHLPFRRLLNACAILWSAGILLFSGSIYLLALAGPRWLGPITPLGGTCLIAGWALLLIMGLKYPHR